MLFSLIHKGGMVQYKLVDEISFNFLELFFKGKYIKKQVKAGDHLAFFLSSTGQKIKNLANFGRKKLSFFTCFISFSWCFSWKH